MYFKTRLSTSLWEKKFNFSIECFSENHGKKNSCSVAVLNNSSCLQLLVKNIKTMLV